MSDSDSDETPGAAGFFVPVSFDKIESFTEAFPFHQAAKVLSINDLQEFRILYRLPGLPSKRYHDNKLIKFMAETGITLCDLTPNGDGMVVLYRDTYKNLKKGELGIPMRCTIPLSALREMPDLEPELRSIVRRYEIHIDKKVETLRDTAKDEYTEAIPIYVFFTDDEKCRGVTPTKSSARVLLQMSIREGYGHVELDLPSPNRPVTDFHVGHRQAPRGQKSVVPPVQMVLEMKPQEANFAASGMVNTAIGKYNDMESQIKFNRVYISSAKLFLDFLADETEKGARHVIETIDAELRNYQGKTQPEQPDSAPGPSGHKTSSSVMPEAPPLRPSGIIEDGDADDDEDEEDEEAEGGEDVTQKNTPRKRSRIAFDPKVVTIDPKLKKLRTAKK